MPDAFPVTSPAARPIQPDARIVAKAGVIACDMESGGALLDTTTNMYYGLNDAGLTVWRMVQAPARIKDVHSALMSRFEVNGEECSQDLNDLVRHLLDADLIRFADEPAR